MTDDALAPAKGCLLGVALGCILWAAIIAGVWWWWT